MRVARANGPGFWRESGLEIVQRAWDAVAALLEHVGVDHGGGEVLNKAFYFVEPPAW
jgi:hypothetical protein